MKKLLLTFILLASFTLGGHVAFAQTATPPGSVQPGGTCAIDADCADPGGVNYGCINKTCTLDTATATGSAADGTIQPGGACTQDTDCADVNGTQYGCYPEGGGVCTVNGTAPADGTVQPGGACTDDNSCADVNGQSYGCYQGQCTLNGDPTSGTGSTSGGATTVAAPSSNTSATTLQGAKCALGDLGCYLTNGLIGILSTAAYYIMIMVGFLLGLVGTVFNWVVVITVFQYAVYFANSAGMLIAWGILRDIGNIVLLFGFIFMGIMIILNLDSLNLKKTLPTLLIFAVLLNFSLFATEAIVDVANVLSATLYKQAGQVSLGSPTTVQSTGTTASGFTQVGIAGAIMHDTYMDTSLDPTKPPINSTVQQLLAFIGTTVFMLIVMVLLLAACVIFFTRAVMLTFLLVVSPLGFAGMAIPAMQARARQWFNQLLSNAFFAPVFLLLMFAGLKVLEAARNSLGGSGTNLATALSNPSTSVGGIFIIFGLTVGFFIAALTYAKSSSVAGASVATSFAQNTVQRAVRAPAIAASGTAGFVGRRTVGRASNYFSNQIAKSNFGRTELGRFAKGITDKGAHASYDLREVKGVSAVLGGSKPSKGATSGFHGIEEKAITERTKYAATLKNNKTEGEAVGELQRQKRDLDEVWNEQKKDFNNAIKNAKTPEAIKEARDNKAAAEKAYNNEKKVFDKQIFDQSAQGQYAKNLEKGNPILNATGLAKFPTVQELADHHAVERIRGNTNKSSIDKALDGIRDETKKAASAGGGGAVTH